jgi:tetratricopeptide (TPR) repeat protein
MSAQSLFQEGVKNFEAKNFDSALNSFEKALIIEPNNVTLLVNKALAHFELGQKYEALAHMIKAQKIDPDFQPASLGLEFLTQQIQIKAIPHQIELYEQIRNLLVINFNLYLILFFVLIFFSLLGAFCIRHYNQKRQAFLAGQDPEPVSNSTWISTSLFIVSSFWALFFVWDSQQSRGVIRQESITLRTAPDVNSPTILQLNGGLEVRLLHRQDNWIQIQYPGSFSGWVEKNSVLEL